MKAVTLSERHFRRSCFAVPVTGSAHVTCRSCALRCGPDTRRRTVTTGSRAPRPAACSSSQGHSDIAKSGPSPTLAQRPPWSTPCPDVPLAASAASAMARLTRLRSLPCRKASQRVRSRKRLAVPDKLPAVVSHAVSLPLRSAPATAPGQWPSPPLSPAHCPSKTLALQA